MDTQSKEVPFLIAQNGPLQGQSWAIRNEIVIGREAGCDIVINERQVSRRHVQIYLNSDNQINISDLNSKNGTLLNGDFVNTCKQLKDGDEIIVGLIQAFTFVSSDATLPLVQKQQQDAGTTQKLFIDKKARRIWIGEKELLPPLSVSQYYLLVFLYENQGSVMTRQDVVHAVWGEEEAIGVTEQALDALVRRLRNQLKKFDPTHEYVLTIRGVGFKFENELYK